MGATATARFPGRGEHQKARYRLLVCGILALLGPPAFGVPVGFFSAIFSIILVGYALWGLRLTVVFHDDDSLGLLLALFDVALTLPLVIWGTHAWMSIAIGILWVLTLLSSIGIRRGRLDSHSGRGQPMIDSASGLYTANYLAEAVQHELAAGSRNGGRGGGGRGHLGGHVGCGLILIRVQRFADYQSFFGPEAAGRLVGAVVRRSVRVLGPDAEGFRVGPDRIAFLVPLESSIEVAEIAVGLSRAAGGKLVDGRKVDLAVGYAVAPRDGLTAGDLVRAASESALEPAPAASRSGAMVVVPREIAGSGAAVG